MVNGIPSRVSVDLTSKKRALRGARRSGKVSAAAAGFCAVAVAGAAYASPWWRTGAAAVGVAFDATAGIGYVYQRHRRPSCEPSGDAEYPCLVSRPPNAFEGEIALYFSGEKDHLSVKIVIPGVTRSGKGGGGTGWAALGFSPTGKMAGPSEADVGFLLEEEDLQGRAISRYRMNGYSASSVVPLSECHQVLTDGRVHSTVDGSLVVSFRRPWITATVPPSRHEERCTAGGEEGSVVAKEGGMDWLDPREDGVVVLWAYSLRGAWPSYHDANGAFILPRLSGDNSLDGEAGGYRIE